MLVLRTCNADMTSAAPEANGFKWPRKGPVACKDWLPARVCGHGLHGLLRGEGDASLLSSSPDAKWLAVEVRLASVVEIDSRKCKFPRGIVRYAGDRQTATGIIVARHPGARCVFGTATAGYSGTATAGYCGTATAGYCGAISILWYDESGRRYRRAIGVVGENGLLPNVKYRCVAGKLVPA